MRSLVGIFSLALLIASPYGDARMIPDPNQKPAPGNHEEQTPIHLANYSPLVNYNLQCRGCHLTNGEGVPRNDVPMMKGFLGHFLKVEGGREFLAQVPGSSQSALSHQQLAELLNWMLEEDGIAGGSAPEKFKKYTGEEIGLYRHVMIKDLVGHRKSLIDKIRKLGIDIPADVMP